MMRFIILILIILFYFDDTYAQCPPRPPSYATEKIKEKYDLLNTLMVQSANACNYSYLSSQADLGNNLGDGISNILEGYITMYKTTRDKAYLYKYLFQVNCILMLRNDNTHQHNSQPIWSQVQYQDGLLCAALARFVHLVKIEDTSLQSEIIHIGLGNIPTGLTTFGDFANWLGTRVSETVNWYVIGNATSHDYWDSNLAIQNTPNEGKAAEINKQVGFGRALLLLGQAIPDANYKSKAMYIANKFINTPLNYSDPCSGFSLNNAPVFRDFNGGYMWYHRGWQIATKSCVNTTYPFNHQNVPNLTAYLEFIEDLSHGYMVSSFVLDSWYFQTGTPFSNNDLIKFKNTFTRNLYDGGTSFWNAVTGVDTPVERAGANGNHNFYSMIAFEYMPFEHWDDGSVGRCVYNILMNHYQNVLSSATTPPSDYGGMSNKGHAEVVAAQWKYECFNLELYNRNVVYNQDFFAQNKLIVTPDDSNLPSGASYAEPIIYTKEFIVPSGITVNMTAGESITLKAGVQIKAGSTFNASVISINPCNDGMRLASGGGKGKNQPLDLPIISPTAENAKQIVNAVIKLRAVPNPFTNSTSIQFSLEKESKVNIKLIDLFGRVVYDTKEDLNGNAGFNEVVISTDNLGQGLYNCILKIKNDEIQTIKIIKQ